MNPRRTRDARGRDSAARKRPDIQCHAAMRRSELGLSVHPSEMVGSIKAFPSIGRVRGACGTSLGDDGPGSYKDAAGGRRKSLKRLDSAKESEAF